MTLRNMSGYILRLAYSYNLPYNCQLYCQIPGEISLDSEPKIEMNIFFEEVKAVHRVLVKCGVAYLLFGADHSQLPYYKRSCLKRIIVQ